MTRPFIHILLHFLVPFGVALVFYRPQWRRATVIMLLGILIDVDHLWADPIYAPARCSLGFHWLHSYWIMPFYAILLCFKRSRLLGLGLVIHMILDATDCVAMKIT